MKKQNKKLLLRKGTYRVPVRGTNNKNGIWMEVRVMDVREQYGRIDVQIIPTSGTGSAWVSRKAVRLYGGD